MFKAFVLLVCTLVVFFLLTSQNVVMALESLQYSQDCANPNTPFCHVQFKLQHPSNIVMELTTPSTTPQLNNTIPLTPAEEAVAALLLKQQHAESFDEYVTLPINLESYGISIQSSHSNVTYVSNCAIVNTTADTTLVRLRSLWYHEQINAVNFTTNLMQRYNVQSRIVECRFDLTKSEKFYGKDVMVEPQIVPLNVVHYDMDLLQKDGIYKILSTTNNIAMLPPLLFTPSIYRPDARPYGNDLTHVEIDFIANLTATPQCYNSLASSTTVDQQNNTDEGNGFNNNQCVGSLVNLPTSLFPLTLITTHNLDLSAMAAIFNTPKCPLIITTLTNNVDGQIDSTTHGTGTGLVETSPALALMNYYILSFPQNNQGQNIPVGQSSLVSCDGLVLTKDGLGVVHIAKSFSLQVQASDIGLLPNVEGNNNKLQTFMYNTMLYNNYQLQTKFSDKRLLGDCFDQTDARCTAVIIIHPVASYATSESRENHRELMKIMLTQGFGLQFQYLDEHQYFTNGLEVELPVSQQHHKVSWLSMISTEMDLIRYHECDHDPTYLEWGLDWHLTGLDGTADPDSLTNPPPFVFCLTLRKSLQSGITAPGNDKVQIGASSIPGVDSQLIKVSFGGQYFQQQGFLLQFTSAYPIALNASNYGNLPLVPNVDYPLLIMQLPIPTYSMVVEAIWDTETCENPKTQYCFATYRSKYVGGPLTITIDRNSILIKNMAIESVQCNSMNMAIGATTYSIVFPNPQLLTDQQVPRISGSSYANLTPDVDKFNPFIVTLRDPYDHTKILTHHECIVKYSQSYNINTVHYQAQANQTIAWEALVNSGVVKHEAHRGLQQQVEAQVNQGIALEDVRIEGTASLRPFYGVDLNALEAQGVLEIAKLPTMFDWNDKRNQINAMNFLLVESIVERSVVPRPNLYSNANSLSELSHFPLFSTVVTDARWDEQSDGYIFNVGFVGLQTSFKHLLLEIVENDNCQDKTDAWCTLNFTYPSYDWLIANGFNDNTLRTFSFFVDGVDANQVGFGQYELIIPHDNNDGKEEEEAEAEGSTTINQYTGSSNGLINDVVNAQPTIVSWNELNQQYNIEPVIPLQMPQEYRQLYFLDEESFDKDAEKYAIWDITIVDGLGDGNITNIYHDTSLPLQFQLKYRKVVEYYFQNEYLNIYPYLLSWGKVYKDNNLYRVISQPPLWATYDVSSQFQPLHPLEIDTQSCSDPYSSQCRVFIHRRDAIDETIYFTTDLWSYNTGGVPFYHPQVGDGNTPIYLAELPAMFGTIVPTTLSVRPNDPTAWATNLAVIEFANGNDPKQNVEFDHVFRITFPYTQVPHPTVGDDCIDHSELYCTLTYPIVRPIYLPEIATVDYIIAKHNLTSSKHFYINELLLQLNGNEKDMEDYTYQTTPDSVSVIVEGNRNHPLSQTLANKLIATIEGSKHPDHADNQLVFTLSITKDNQPTVFWFAGPSYHSILDIEIKFVKTVHPLPIQLLTQPQIYSSIPLLRDNTPHPIATSLFKPIVLRAGTAYHPIRFFSGENCQTSPRRREDFRCSITMRISASQKNPLTDLSRLIPASSQPHPALPPVVLYFFTKDLPDLQVNSQTPEAMRAPYRQFECAKLTFAKMNFTTTPDLLNRAGIGEEYHNSYKVIDRWFYTLEIYPEFQTRHNTQCYLTLKHTPFLENYWKYLVEDLKVYQDYNELNIIPPFKMQFYANRGTFMPTNLVQAFWTGTELILNDEGFAKATWPAVLPNDMVKPDDLSMADFFKLAVLTEISGELQADYGAINGLGQLEEYRPVMDIPAISLGPALQLWAWEHVTVPELWLKEMPTIYGKPSSTIAPPHQYGEPGFDDYGYAQGYQQKFEYVRYEFDFISDVVDLTFDTNLGHASNTFYPCINHSLSESFLAVDAYLIFTNILTEYNAYHNVSSNDGRVLPNLLDFDILSKVPQWVHPLIKEQIFAKLRIAGLLHFDEISQKTKMYINPDLYLTSQLNDFSVGTPDKQYDKIVDLLNTQYQAENKKQTLNKQMCYFYSPLNLHFPTKTNAVQHTMRLAFPGARTVDGKPHHFTSVVPIEYQKYTKTAQLHSVDDSLIYKDELNTASIHYNIDVLLSSGNMSTLMITMIITFVTLLLAIDII